MQCRVRARYQFLLARLSRDQVVARFLLKSCYYQITSCSIIAILSLSCLNAFGHDAKVVLHTGHRAVHFFFCYLHALELRCESNVYCLECIKLLLFQQFCFSFWVMIKFLFEGFRCVCFSIYGLQIWFMLWLLEFLVKGLAVIWKPKKCFENYWEIISLSSPQLLYLIGNCL